MYLSTDVKHISVNKTQSKCNKTQRGEKTTATATAVVTTDNRAASRQVERVYDLVHQNLQVRGLQFSMLIHVHIICVV